MQALLESGQESHFANMKHHIFESFEAGYGRIENRFCHVVEIPKDHPQREKWRNLKTLAIIVSARTIKGKESWESRLYVSSHPSRAKFLANAIRRHWSIENSQHYVLDVTFD